METFVDIETDGSVTFAIDKAVFAFADVTAVTVDAGSVGGASVGATFIFGRTFVEIETNRTIFSRIITLNIR